MKRGSFSQITVGATSQAFLGSSPNRTCIMVSSPPVGHITIAPVGVVIDSGGIVVQQGQPPIHLREDNAGDLVQRAWQAIADAGGRVVGVIECIEDGVYP